MEKTKNTNKGLIETMFKAGAHFAFSRSRRHPSAKPYIFGAKNRVEIFDLEKTSEKLEAAKEFVKNIAAQGGQMLFVGGKSESRAVVEKAALSVDMPYVAGRWVGGTFTNFSEIRRRIDKLERMITDKEKGTIMKYTKKERLLMDREMENLQILFGGIRIMRDLPKAIFVIDAKREFIAVTEAKKTGVPIIALCGSDNDLSTVERAIPGNDSSLTSITFFVNEITEAYNEGKKLAPAKPKPTETQPAGSPRSTSDMVAA